MKLDLNKAFVGLDGHEIPQSDAPETMGVFLAKALAGSPKGDPIKFWDWALALHAGKPIEIDDADKTTLLNFVADSTTFTVLARAQLQRALTNLTP